MGDLLGKGVWKNKFSISFNSKQKAISQENIGVYQNSLNVFLLDPPSPLILRREWAWVKRYRFGQSRKSTSPCFFLQCTSSFFWILSQFHILIFFLSNSFSRTLNIKFHIPSWFPCTALHVCGPSYSPLTPICTVKNKNMK